jgi:hypothetical protein
MPKNVRFNCAFEFPRMHEIVFAKFGPFRLFFFGFNAPLIAPLKTGELFEAPAAHLIAVLGVPNLTVLATLAESNISLSPTLV